MKISSADTVQQSDSAVNLTVNSGVKVGWNALERSSGAHQFGHKHSRAQAHNTLKVLMACSSGGPDIRRESRFFIQHLHWTPPLILIVYSGLERGIQSATEKLPLKRGARVLHSCNCPPPHLMDMHIADALVHFPFSQAMFRSQFRAEISRTGSQSEVVY